MFCRAVCRLHTNAIMKCYSSATKSSASLNRVSQVLMEKAVLQLLTRFT